MPNTVRRLRQCALPVDTEEIFLLESNQWSLDEDQISDSYWESGFRWWGEGDGGN
jgi:hypothetical protein